MTLRHFWWPNSYHIWRSYSAHLLVIHTFLKLGRCSCNTIVWGAHVTWWHLTHKSTQTISHQPPTAKKKHEKNSTNFISEGKKTWCHSTSRHFEAHFWGNFNRPREKTTKNGHKIIRLWSPSVENLAAPSWRKGETLPETKKEKLRLGPPRHERNSVFFFLNVLMTYTPEV